MLFGACLKLGFLAYLVIFSQLIDFYGRKQPLVWGLIGHIVTLIALAFAPHNCVQFVYVMQFLSSALYHLVFYSGWIYLLELLPDSYHSMAITISSIGKSFSMIAGALFFMLALKDMDCLLLFNAAAGSLILSLICLVPSWYPESPRYF